MSLKNWHKCHLRFFEVSDTTALIEISEHNIGNSSGPYHNSLSIPCSKDVQNKVSILEVGFCASPGLLKQRRRRKFEGQAVGAMVGT